MYKIIKQLINKKLNRRNIFLKNNNLNFKKWEFKFKLDNLEKIDSNKFN